MLFTGEGVYTVTELQEGEGSQVVVEELVSAPSSEAVCVALSHKRDLAPGAPANATIPDLQVSNAGDRFLDMLRVESLLKYLLVHLIGVTTFPT